MPTVKNYKPHPAAKLFPMMSEAELKELAADIEKNGQHDPIIITSDDLILDGRNRLEACRRAGVEPEIQLWDREEDQISPVSWVLSKNLMRRQLTDGQRILVAVEALPMLEKEARARQKMGAPAGAKVGPSGKSAQIAAAAMKVAPRSVERAKAVLAKASPEEIQKIRTGEKTFGQVERETKRAEQVQQIRAYVAPQGEYEVIAADPPWKFEDELDGEGARGGLGYPPMTLEEICALTIPAAKDCLLALWITNTHLIEGWHVPVLKAWGFTGKTIFTWNKVNIGAGWTLRNVTEHCIFAVRGKPVVLGESTPTLSPPWPRSSVHSEKPAQFYELLERICPAQSRLEMFAREPREGWTTTGAELKVPIPAPRSHHEVEEPEVEDNICGGANCSGCPDHPAAPAAPVPAAPARGPKRLRWVTHRDGSQIANGRDHAWRVERSMVGVQIYVGGEPRPTIFESAEAAKAVCEAEEGGAPRAPELTSRLVEPAVEPKRRARKLLLNPEAA